jgi:hemerythrin-like domain-containing protein
MQVIESRRGFLSGAALGGAGFLLAARVSAADAGAGPKEADVNATEDLMREHGVLRRVLLVYAEAARRISTGTPPPADVVSSAAGVIQHFIEAYHEKLEEEELFPRLERAGKLVDLCHTLKAQHEAGRKLTADILSGSTAAALKSKGQAKKVVAAMAAFTRMYEPHAAREDTVLFPAFHSLFTEKEFDELGDRFEDKEHEVLGQGGFEGTVETVAQLERALQIYELAQFTPAKLG